MDEQFDFRVLLLKLQDCLSDNDRRRLHFIVGDTIPRYLRDDPTLGGTLSLLESLFDRAKISEQDFDYLIQAFSEIHCYEGVQRLREYQLVKQGSDRRETILSEVMEDNEDDKITMAKNFSNSITVENTKPNESTSTQSTFVSFDKESINIQNLPVEINSTKTEKKTVNINLTFIKQTLKSRLTVCQLVLLILNILGILTIVIVTVILRKQPCSGMNLENILIIQEGLFYGEPLGGDPFNDASTDSLTLNDQVIGINATWAFDNTLSTITFLYSNGQSSQHGTGDTIRYPMYSNAFNLLTLESFNSVTLYVGLRDIINPYKPNGTIIVVGIQFFTNKGRQTQLLGSSNGTEYSETFSDYILAYAQGRSYAFIDGLQFVWKKGFQESPTSMIANV